MNKNSCDIVNSIRILSEYVGPVSNNKRGRKCIKEDESSFFVFLLWLGAYTTFHLQVNRGIDTMCSIVNPYYMHHCRSYKLYVPCAN